MSSCDGTTTRCGARTALWQEGAIPTSALADIAASHASESTYTHYYCGDVGAYAAMTGDVVAPLASLADFRLQLRERVEWC